MTEEQNTVEESEQTVPPSVKGGEDAAEDERTSPFPYSENFAKWVADETAAPDGRQHRREADSGDESTS